MIEEFLLFQNFASRNYLKELWLKVFKPLEAKLKISKLKNLKLKIFFLNFFLNNFEHYLLDFNDWRMFDAWKKFRRKIIFLIIVFEQFLAFLLGV